ncbi:MAG: hypothetical protein ACXWPM_01040 [Bdellovibrionota bacterium]
MAFTVSMLTATPLADVRVVFNGNARVNVPVKLLLPGKVPQVTEPELAIVCDPVQVAPAVPKLQPVYWSVIVLPETLQLLLPVPAVVAQVGHCGFAALALRRMSSPMDAKRAFPESESFQPTVGAEELLLETAPPATEAAVPDVDESSVAAVPAHALRSAESASDEKTLRTDAF